MKTSNRLRTTLTCLVIAGSQLFGSASALSFTSAQLAQLIQKPQSFKPTDSGIGNVNNGVSAFYWEWGDPLESGTKLTRLNGNAGAWSLDLSDKAYPLTKIAAQRQLLATLDDPYVYGPLDLYLIKSGVFKGQYLERQRFHDGRISISVTSKAYAVTAAKGSELQQSGNTQIYSYPLATFLLYKSGFCAIAGASCK